MAPIVNKDFTELAVDGSNYLTWAIYGRLNNANSKRLSHYN